MTEKTFHVPEPEWDDVFNDPAIRAVSCLVPSNDAGEHTGDDDGRIRENMLRRAPWMRKILAGAMAEVDAE